MTPKSSTLGDLEGPLGNLLCQSCDIMAKRYVVAGRRW